MKAAAKIFAIVAGWSVLVWTFAGAVLNIGGVAYVPWWVVLAPMTMALTALVMILVFILVWSWLIFSKMDYD